MFIRSERLFLRPGWPEDWAELHTLIDDEHVVRHLEKAPWPYRPEDARDFAAREQDEAHPHFFITLPGADGAQLIGCAGLIANENACAEGETTQDEPGAPIRPRCSATGSRASTGDRAMRPKRRARCSVWRPRSATGGLPRGISSTIRARAGFWPSWASARLARSSGDEPCPHRGQPDSRLCARPRASGPERRSAQGAFVPRCLILPASPFLPVSSC
jgi:hypothetical protein